jgi:hypothetical protein
MAPKTKPPRPSTPWFHTEDGKVRDAARADFVAQFRSEDDARFAVRAANAHEALVKALELSESRILDHIEPGSHQVYDKWLAEVRAAIKLAKEGK